MSGVVHAVPGEPRVPRVVREGDRPQLVVGIDLDLGYDVREVHFPLTVEHLAVPLRPDVDRKVSS